MEWKGNREQGSLQERVERIQQTSRSQGKQIKALKKLDFEVDLVEDRAF